jgi:hypothetical protein
VDELDSGGELVMARSGIIEQPRAGQREHRTHALAAARDEMAGELGIKVTSLCMRSRMTRFTLLRSAATSCSIGSSEGARLGESW